MRYIKVRKNKIAKIDDVDYALVSKVRWFLSVNHPEKGYKHGNYAYGVQKIGKEWKRVSMHRFIMKPEGKLQVDHINSKGLDNRRSNLRLCTRSMNAANQGLNSRNKSGFKGVCWNEEKKKWSVEIRAHGKSVFIGRFKNKVKAALSYNRKATELFGEFARLNHIASK